MIAENKQEFFEQLQRELQKLGVEDTSELMSDLEEHFEEGERRGAAESEICRELGSIAEIARSCLDLKSTAINSMVARDVERKKGVSLTKPGRSVPADPSLSAAKKEAEDNSPQDRDGSASANGEISSNTALDSADSSPNASADDLGEIGGELPSYTPEHVSSEIFPNAAQQAASQSGAGIGSNAANVGSSGIPNDSTDSAANNGSSGTDGNVRSTENANADGSATGSNTGADGETNAASDPNGTSSGSASVNGGTFEKVGKAVDIVCDKAGKALNDAFGKAGSAMNGAFEKAGNAVNGALNKAGSAVGAFRPSDSYRKNINSSKNGGDMPPQYTKVKTSGGGKFIDTTGLQPNVNGGRLLCEILLDIFVWIWLIPVVFSLVVTAFAAAVSLIGTGIVCILAKFDFAQYKFVTRLLFALGFWNLSAAVFCLACALTKAAVSLVKHVISRHIKAVYDI